MKTADKTRETPAFPKTFIMPFTDSQRLIEITIPAIRIYFGGMMFIGVLYGGIAGLAGGKVERLMMHVVDVLYAIPMLLYVILLMVVFKPGLLGRADATPSSRAPHSVAKR